MNNETLGYLPDTAIAIIRDAREQSLRLQHSIRTAKSYLDAVNTPHRPLYYHTERAVSDVERTLHHLEMAIWEWEKIEAEIVRRLAAIPPVTTSNGIVITNGTEHEGAP